MSRLSSSSGTFHIRLDTFEYREPDGTVTRRNLNAPGWWADVMPPTDPRVRKAWQLKNLFPTGFYFFDRYEVIGLSSVTLVTRIRFPYWAPFLLALPGTCFCGEGFAGPGAASARANVNPAATTSAPRPIAARNAGRCRAGETPGYLRSVFAHADARCDETAAPASPDTLSARIPARTRAITVIPDETLIFPPLARSIA